MKSEWLRVELALALPAALEAVTYWGHQVGSGGVEVVDGSKGPTVVVHLPRGEQGRERLASLQQQLHRLTPIFGAPVLRGINVQPVAAVDWAEGWKQYYGPQPIGQSLVVVPTWLRASYTVPLGRYALYLDPGTAFGTGEHTTTRQALIMLERALAEPRRRVVDVGAGSGILAMAAARLGAAAVLALEIDPVAVAVAVENVAANGLADRITVVEADVAVVDRSTLAQWWPDANAGAVTAAPVAVGPGDAKTAGADGADNDGARADVVVSNILLDVLVQRAAPLAALVRPGGSLILAGVLTKEEQALRQAFTAQGMECVEALRDGEWLAARFQPSE